MIPVEGHKGLYRDEKSNAIVNCNDYEYQEYLRVKNSTLDEKCEIQNLKTELTEIKLLLAKLLENKS
jgi:predicted SAM-dependent methyltransferase